jgi:iron complex transport system substrate-binding protein
LIAGIDASLLWGAEKLSVETLSKELNIHGPIRRVVTQNSDALEIMRLLKAEDLVVGVMSIIDKEPEFWGDLARLPHIGNWREPDLETVINLDPDLFIAYKHSPTKEWENKIAAHGIPVLRIDFFRLEKLEEEVRILGLLLGKEAEAERFCAWNHRILSDIRGKASSISPHPRVYIEGYSDYRASGQGTGGNELCNLAGGRNIAAESKITSPRVTPEWVVEQNPQVIVRSVSDVNGYILKNPAPLQAHRNAIMKRPAWKHIEAVAQERVYAVDNSVWVGPRGVIGLTYLAKWFHPGQFTDLQPETLHKQYFDHFQGVPYQGVYVSEPAYVNE